MHTLHAYRALGLCSKRCNAMTMTHKTATISVCGVFLPFDIKLLYRTFFGAPYYSFYLFIYFFWEKLRARWMKGFSKCWSHISDSENCEGRSTASCEAHTAESWADTWRPWWGKKRMERCSTIQKPPKGGYSIFARKCPTCQSTIIDRSNRAMGIRKLRVLANGFAWAVQATWITQWICYRYRYKILIINLAIFRAFIL